MTKETDKAAKLACEIFKQIDALSSAIDLISDVYVSDEEELNDLDHPVSKATSSYYATKVAFESLIHSIIKDKLIELDFRRALQQEAVIDALKNGNSSLVNFVRKHVIN